MKLGAKRIVTAQKEAFCMLALEEQWNPKKGSNAKSVVLKHARAHRAPKSNTEEQNEHAR